MPSNHPTSLASVVVPSGALPDQPWANALHTTINQAYLYTRKDIDAFPANWGRLDPHPEKGIKGLAQELTPLGSLVVLFEGEMVVACGGFEPFRGVDWINKEKSANETLTEIFFADSSTKAQPPPPSGEIIKDWDVCCFCVHPTYRRSGLSKTLLRSVEDAVKQRGGERLMACYCIAETGDYWPRMGFETMPGSESMLKKGFTYAVGTEGLREDLHFLMGAKALT